MRYGILGPTQVRRTDGREVTVGGPRLRALLALLLVDAGKVVSAARLIDGLYGGSPPSDATNALQSQISRLRQLLRDEDQPGSPVEFHPAGYRLVVEGDEVDAHRFERLAAEGRRALATGDRPRAAALLREALGLWRGPALADLGEVPFAHAQAVRLEELRVSAVEDRVEAELALGGHPALVAELEQLVAAYPLRERLRGQLMRALYADGRQAEALAVFKEARRTLAEELGADPSAELAAVHLAAAVAAGAGLRGRRCGGHAVMRDHGRSVRLPAPSAPRRQWPRRPGGAGRCCWPAACCSVAATPPSCWHATPPRTSVATADGRSARW